MTDTDGNPINPSPDAAPDLEKTKTDKTPSLALPLDDEEFEIPQLAEAHPDKENATPSEIPEINTRILLRSNVLDVADKLEKSEINGTEAAKKLRAIAADDAYDLALDDIEIDVDDVMDEKSTAGFLVSALLSPASRKDPNPADPVEEALALFLQIRDSRNAHGIIGDASPVSHGEYRAALCRLRDVLVANLPETEKDA